MTVEQVCELQKKNSTITISDLKDKINPTGMNELEVYALIWKEKEEVFEYFTDRFSTLQTVFVDAAKNGEALIVLINKWDFLK